MSLLPRLACAARRVRAPLLTRAASTSSAATGDAGAEQRTHQYIGRHQQLFTIHESSPGRARERGEGQSWRMVGRARESTVQLDQGLCFHGGKAGFEVVPTWVYQLAWTALYHT